IPSQLNLGLTAVAFISPQNHPILLRTLSSSSEDLFKYHYLAHTSLGVIEKRGNVRRTLAVELVIAFNPKLTPQDRSRAHLTDAIVRDADIIS
ncbi:hypothetical protein BGW80DRAFT_1345524, partial [Lactifluus volemus]